MSLNINGNTNITEIKYNGVDLSQLVFNETIVWEKVYTVADSQRVWFACTGVEDSNGSSNRTYTLYRSENDGKTWTSVLTNDFSVTVWVYDNNIVLASSYCKIFYSLDKGKTWTGVSVNYDTYIIKGNNKYLAMANYIDSSGKIYFATSNDGKKWSSFSSKTIQSGTKINANKPLYSNGVYVCVPRQASGGGGYIYYSTTGTTWTKTSISLMNSYGIVDDNGQFILYNNAKDTAQVSTNGKNWTETSCVNLIRYAYPYKMNNKYYMYSRNTSTNIINKLMVSLNGLVWNSVSLDNKIIDITFPGENCAYALGVDSNNTVYRTTNFVDWAEYSEYTQVLNATSYIGNIINSPYIPV